MADEVRREVAVGEELAQGGLTVRTVWLPVQERAGGAVEADDLAEHAQVAGVERVRPLREQSVEVARTRILQAAAFAAAVSEQGPAAAQPEVTVGVVVTAVLAPAEVTPGQ